MKVNRKIIEIDKELCDGCGQYIPSCAEGTLEIVKGKAVMVGCPNWMIPRNMFRSLPTFLVR